MPRPHNPPIGRQPGNAFQPRYGNLDYAQAHEPHTRSVRVSLAPLSRGPTTLGCSQLRFSQALTSFRTFLTRAAPFPHLHIENGSAFRTTGSGEVPVVTLGLSALCGHGGIYTGVDDEIRTHPGITQWFSRPNTCSYRCML